GLLGPLLGGFVQILFAFLLLLWRRFGGGALELFGLLHRADTSARGFFCHTVLGLGLEFLVQFLPTSAHAANEHREIPAGFARLFELFPHFIRDDDLLLGGGDAEEFVQFRIEIDFDLHVSVVVLELRERRRNAVDLPSLAANQQAIEVANRF